MACLAASNGHSRIRPCRYASPNTACTSADKSCDVCVSRGFERDAGTKTLRMEPTELLETDGNQHAGVMASVPLWTASSARAARDAPQTMIQRSALSPRRHHMSQARATLRGLRTTPWPTAAGRPMRSPHAGWRTSARGQSAERTAARRWRPRTECASATISARKLEGRARALQQGIATSPMSAPMSHRSFSAPPTCRGNPGHCLLLYCPRTRRLP